MAEPKERAALSTHDASWLAAFRGRSVVPDAASQSPWERNVPLLNQMAPVEGVAGALPDETSRAASVLRR